MELKELQKKYPEFIYEGYDWKIEDGDLVADFYFAMGEIKFNPSIIIHGINLAQIEKLGSAAISNLIFNMGLAEITSYWKAACCPAIIIKAGYLDKKQIVFWQDLIFNMGQFFYENRLPFIKPKFKIVAAKPKKMAVAKNKFSNRYLAPQGGGKDSLVTLETLRAAAKEIATFTLNAHNSLVKVAAVAGANNIFVERKIDGRLLELNRLGYFNGHTPFSSILAALGVSLAALFDFKYVAISQERSSDEGNARYRGRTINHQYSKSYEFENKFRDYSKKYLAKNIVYFSFLRPLYEIQISKIFARNQKYFGSFLSCNKPFTIAFRDSGAKAGWCGECAKCLSVFAMLYPFAGEIETVKIFGKNLFEDESLIPLMRELCGQTACKPFECVGTTREMAAAFYLSLKNTAKPKPILLDYFQKNILPKYKNIETDSKKIMASWNGKNNLPKDLAAILKKLITLNYETVLR